MGKQYAIGLDYGTNSVRALVADVATGDAVATAVWEYRRGTAGVVLDSRQPDLARQHPADYMEGAIAALRGAVAAAAAEPGFSPAAVVGIGVDATGSTPLPLDAAGIPLALAPKWSANPAAMAWLWKDHTSHAEAEEITVRSRALRSEYTDRCGGRYSSEWFWAKALHCARTAPEVLAAAHTWAEISDWIPAWLAGDTAPARLKRNICAAGHKGLFHPSWGGYPDAEFLAGLHPELARIRATLPNRAHTIAETVGTLAPQHADAVGLPHGIPIAVGALDAHFGAVGSGIAPGVLVKILGTSTCDMMTAPLAQEIPAIPGLCGVVPESILPGFHGFEAGQSAVGDLFNWYVGMMNDRDPRLATRDSGPGAPLPFSHEALTAAAGELLPGESGLLALDWQNGNRTILVDQRLTGLVLGLTLQTRPAEIYRALIEATAFGARRIVERLEEYGVRVDRIVNCGGISLKNPLFLQIYADVLGRPMEVSGSAQTCALGAVIAGAVVGGAHRDFAAAIEAMAHLDSRRFTPNAKAVATYERLYVLYLKLHDQFGTRASQENLFGVMKELLEIRDGAGR